LVAKTAARSRGVAGHDSFSSASAFSALVAGAAITPFEVGQSLALID
jgi:hypothetical protein